MARADAATASGFTGIDTQCTQPLGEPISTLGLLLGTLGLLLGTLPFLRQSLRTTLQPVAGGVEETQPLSLHPFVCPGPDAETDTGFRQPQA